MTKTISGMIWAAGLGMALAACSANEDAAESEGTETSESSDADAPHGAYLTDETGEFTAEVGEAAAANVNDRLASKHAEGGHDIHILIVGSTNGEDSDAAAEAARAGTDADALIYIAVEDQEVAVVGENIDRGEGSGAARAITTAFDNGNFENGLLNGITATEMQMEN
jgi:uncharacterized membrane protein YgcG